MNFSDARNLGFLDLIRSRKSADLLNVKRENYGRKKVLRLLMSSLRLGLTQKVFLKRQMVSGTSL